VTLSFWSTFTGGIRKEYLEQSIERYTAANPNISVELSTAPMGKEMETKLNVSFASGTATLSPVRV
jgi:ABC-type glycerol-3-phosphate transport system substrate-binding protein